MKRNWIALTMLLISIIGPGCVTATKLNNVENLTQHPQFPIAARESPLWTKAALRKVAELEYRLERK
jgi:hypothetical protein